MLRSRLGRAVVALRDNKYAAIARDVPEARTRLLVLLASALPTGIAGAFYGSYVRVASPDAFGIGFLTILPSILLVGGAGTLWGPVVAAFVVTMLSETLADLWAWRNILVAATIILVVVFYPGGMWAAVQEGREIVTSTMAALRARWMRRTRAEKRRALTHGAAERFLDTPHGRIAMADSGSPAGGGGPCCSSTETPPARRPLHASSPRFPACIASSSSTCRGMAYPHADPETSYNVPAYAEVAEAVIAATGLDRPVVFG